VYQVVVMRSGSFESRRVSVERRYSHFLHLHQQLLEEFGEELEEVSLPRKHLTGNFSADIIAEPPLPAGLPGQGLRHPLRPTLTCLRRLLHRARAEAGAHAPACGTVPAGPAAAPGGPGDPGEAAALAETHPGGANSGGHGRVLPGPGGARGGVCGRPQGPAAGPTVPGQALPSRPAGAAGGSGLPAGETCGPAAGGDDSPQGCREGGGVLPLPQGDRGPPVHLRTAEVQDGPLHQDTLTCRQVFPTCG
ncbi:unnamed protein product, partial [Tetraodon nigroviridis]